MEQPAEDSSVFAERLEQLFAGVPNADGKRYTLGQLARRSTEMGYPISETYLSHLRTGRAKSPSLKTAAGIAAASEWMSAISSTRKLPHEPRPNSTTRDCGRIRMSMLSPSGWRGWTAAILRSSTT